MLYFVIPIVCGLSLGYGIKWTINWLNIKEFQIRNQNIILELTSVILWMWAFLNLPLDEAIIFSLISTILVGIGLIDYFTFQIPLLLILIGVGVAFLSVLIGLTYLSSALWGIFVGAIIPWGIMGITWFITKRQGMGYGDIQLGILLGAWLGPVRMAMTLFSASLLSLIAWIAVSLMKEFDKNRAIPLAPFLAVAGIGIYIGSVYYPSFFYLLIIE